MNRKVLAVLVLVLIALAVITFLQSRQPAPAAPESAQYISFVGRDLNMTVLDIQAIRLRDPQSNQSFTINRDATGNWTAPGNEGRLDTATASNIAKTIVIMPYKQMVTLGDNADLTQYGFRPDGVLSVEIVLANSSTGHVIAVGGLAPDGLAYYVLVDDKPDLYLMEHSAVDFLRSQLNKPPLT
jgi:hypothetical protein